MKPATKILPVPNAKWSAKSPSLVNRLLLPRFLKTLNSELLIEVDLSTTAQPQRAGESTVEIEAEQFEAVWKYAVENGTSVRMVVEAVIRQSLDRHDLGLDPFRGAA